MKTDTTPTKTPTMFLREKRSGFMWKDKGLVFKSDPIVNLGRCRDEGFDGLLSKLSFSELEDARYNALFEKSEVCEDIVAAEHLDPWMRLIGRMGQIAKGVFPAEAEIIQLMLRYLPPALPAPESSYFGSVHTFHTDTHFFDPEEETILRNCRKTKLIVAFALGSSEGEVLELEGEAVGTKSIDGLVKVDSGNIAQGFGKRSDYLDYFPGKFLATLDEGSGYNIARVPFGWEPEIASVKQLGSGEFGLLLPTSLHNENYGRLVLSAATPYFDPSLLGIEHSSLGS